MATTGAQGLAAMQPTAQGRGARTTGSGSRSRGMGGGPSGFFIAPPATLKSIFGFAETAGLPVAVSSAPPAIQALMMSSSLSGSLSFFGGIAGSSACVTTLKSKLPSGSPELMTGPLLLPARELAYVLRSSPAFFLSGLWQLRQLFRR